MSPYRIAPSTPVDSAPRLHARAPFGAALLVGLGLVVVLTLELATGSHVQQVAAAYSPATGRFWELWRDIDWNTFALICASTLGFSPLFLLGRCQCLPDGTWRVRHQGRVHDLDSDQVAILDVTRVGPWVHVRLWFEDRTLSVVLVRDRVRPTAGLGRRVDALLRRAGDAAWHTATP